MKKLAMVVGTNFEEIEMVATVDVLRRANIEVNIISLFNEKTLTGAHKIRILADQDFKTTNFDAYDGIILPGGYGVDHGEHQLIEVDDLITLVQQFNDKKKLVAALCAAPQVLGKAKITKNRNVTHFPGSDKYLDDAINHLDQPAIIDGNIITGASAGSAIQFALKIVKYFQGADASEDLAKSLVMNYR